MGVGAVGALPLSLPAKTSPLNLSRRIPWKEMGVGVVGKRMKRVNMKKQKTKMKMTSVAGALGKLILLVGNNTNKKFVQNDFLVA